ncbi:hypothetical protein K4K58_008239 [Colletotrichum sp. SAR11_239]|nr:hypothetical protein K4K58_008239 [Colletotrichum sp. SAR11_239]
MSSQRGSFGYTDPNFPPPTGEWDTPVIIYGYTPSIALAGLAAALFFILLLIHTAQLVRHRSWYFATFPVGLLFEIVGYVARSLSAKKNPYNLIYFILNYFFIVTAPVFLAAGIYTILSALIHRLGRAFSPLPPKVVLWFFITSDVIATITQISGAALIGVKQSRREDPTTANNILLETAEGLGGHLYSNEVYFGVLEFAPVALAVILFAIWHPGRCVAKKVSGGLGDVEKARISSHESNQK